MSGEFNHLLISAGELRDATGIAARPGALWLRPDRSVAAAGAPRDVETEFAAHLAAHPDSEFERLERPSDVLIPALVNVHAHLDLTHLGARPFSGDFIEWVDRLRMQRAPNEEAIRRSCERGIELARAGGTAIVGDISGMGSMVPFHALADSRVIRGVSFVEFFGHGKWAEQTIEHMREVERISRRRPARDHFRPGLQPHAPYSAGKRLYDEANTIARRSGLRRTTHLAETRAELEFIASATGPFADLVRRLGRWDPAIVGHDVHPIDYLSEALSVQVDGQTGWIVAHVNYAESHHLDFLRKADATVAYCPRASTYFGHENHPYREMLEHGVRVALGTDSIVCLDTPDRLSIIDEMRLLRQRDGTSLDTLLRMATVNGADALGFDRHLVSFQPTSHDTPKPLAGVIPLPFDRDDPADALTQALDGDATFTPIMF